MNTDDLRQLARLYSVQLDYVDVAKRRWEAKQQSLLQTLRILGAPVERIGDVSDALRQRRRQCWQTMVEPVVVAWDGRPARIRIRVASGQASAAASFRMELEDGQCRQYDLSLDEFSPIRRGDVDGEAYLAFQFDLPEKLPWGYHRLVVELGDRQTRSLIISAPRMAYAEPPGGKRHFWGVFLPLYALHRESSWGAGDFSDLEALMQWVAEQGGSLVATLPLLSTLWELDGDPSPYSPASRLFWNEFYLDVTRIPEFAGCAAARRILENAEIREDQHALRLERLVDYRRQMRIKRGILWELAKQFFLGDDARRSQLERYRSEHPRVDEFARFRAVGERQGRTWTEWPEPLRGGRIVSGDYDEAVHRYHLYTQWQIEEQLREMSETARSTDLLWYLDFPLGVSGSSYDVWRWRDSFALGAAGGAPPDTFFTKGQNWGFPPLNPQTIRQQHYQYLIASLRRHLAYARVLRIDHAMSLHRLFWVPEGMSPSEGVYVRYPRDELFALLSLESHRHQSRIIGENLGTVPDVFNEAMKQHNVGDMYVVQYELQPDDQRPLAPVSARAAASINTHDMPPFASFWTGLEIDDRLDLGLLDEPGASEARDQRAAMRGALVALLRRLDVLSPASLDPEAVLQACLALLAAGPAPIVLVNLEDLWEETLPQNTPGTWDERPNWRRKARYSFEQFRELPNVIHILNTVNEFRAQADKQERSQ
ncbi:MAG: 4-alpha-glucanotransferase [Rhodopirellula sp.]|nr:4-alpha-glucanotransferase [Rhodopirellula sp.]